MICKIADESLPRFESWTCHLFAQVRPVRRSGPADVRSGVCTAGAAALTRYPACHHQQDAGDQPGCKDAPPGLPLPEGGSREDQEALPDTCQSLPAPALDHLLIPREAGWLPRSSAWLPFRWSEIRMAWTAAEPPDASETASLTPSPSRHRRQPLGKARERCLGVVAESSILSAGPSLQFDQFVCSPMRREARPAVAHQIGRFNC
jgi:hypothetical protein